MRPSTAPIADLHVELDSASSVPLYLQLYDQLRCRILHQRGLAPGMKLPSTRTLAATLDLSRNTVLAAFEQLLAEGYLEGRLGSGTYVARQLPEAYLAPRSEAPSPAVCPLRAPRLSRRGAELQRIRYTSTLNPGQFGETKPRPFRLYTPALDRFPYDTWRKLMNRCWDRMRPELLDCGDPGGYRPLREAIADHVRATRSVRCDWEQVMVLPSSKLALHLVARTLLDPGDPVLIEDPSYLGFTAAFAEAGEALTPVPVDSEGFDIRIGEQLSPEARLACVTPSHQHPLGVTMSLPRRLALLDWAKRREAWIIEDDYDSEFRYAGRPIASLQGLDDSHRVFYLGTFSKTLLASLRLAYLIVPPDLINIFRAARAHLDWSCPIFEQTILTEFLREGHFARHVRRMRSLYQERQQMLQTAALRHLPPGTIVPERHGGMHLLAWLPPGACDQEVGRRALAAGVEVTPVSMFALRPGGRPGLLLGFAAFEEREMEQAMQKLAPLIT